MPEPKDRANASPAQESTAPEPSPDPPPDLRPSPDSADGPDGPWTDVVARIADRTRQHPQAIALTEAASGRSLTYGELWATSGRLARLLRHRGVGPERAVGVYCDRRLEWLIATLTVWRAGGVYLPLDPKYPPHRLTAMVEDAAPSLLLIAGHRPTSPKALAALPTLDLRELESPEDSVADPEPCDAAAEPNHGLLDPRQAAYVLFTSGSSGRPKGVVVSRRALAWYAAAATQHYALQADDRLLQMASASFDISVGEVFPLLAVGARVVLFDPRGVDPATLFEQCRQHGITVLFPATAFWHELARELAERPEVLPPTLRLVSFGGERVAPTLLASWLRGVGSHPRLVNGYGPTETTVEATVHTLTEPGADTDPRLIGRPVLAVRTQVVDPEGQPVADEASGELTVAGPGLARGYLRHPARTAASFVPDPEASQPGGRRYRTGDLVRRRADGRHLILGRRDRQLKVRGLRVEPEEIEHLIEQHPGVRTAVVTVTTLDGDPAEGADTTEPRHLVATVVPTDGPNDDASTVHPEALAGDSPTAGGGVLGVGTSSSGQLARQLRRYLADHLPPALRPSRYRVRDHLPLTPAGKIDRQALARLARRDPSAPVPASKPPSIAASSVLQPASDDLATRLGHIWQRMLGIESPSQDAPFLELGGDSILALRIVAEAARQGITLRPADLFEHPTLARLSRHLERQQPRSVPPPALPTLAPSTSVPLTPVQAWFFEDAAMAEPHHFNQSMQLLVTRPLEPRRLRRALRHLVARHEALRMRFEYHSEHQSGWRQRPAPIESSGLLLEADLGALPSATSRHRAWQRVADGVQRSLDLAQGPLLRAALLTVDPPAEAPADSLGDAPGDAPDTEVSSDAPSLGPPRAATARPTAPPTQRLLLVVHHLVVDGVSWGILLEDLEQLYDTLTNDALTNDPQAKSSTESAEQSLAGPAEDSLGTPYRTWARIQVEHARSAVLAAEAPRWLQRARRATPIPRDRWTSDRVDTLAAERVESVALAPHLTEELLRRVPAAYGTQIDDLLLTAVLEAFIPWTGGDDLLLDLESHGRQTLVPGVELTRTVGWFTATYPVHLRRASNTTNSGEARLRRTLCSIRDQLAAIPHRGLGYGILHYLSPDPAIRGRLRLLPRPEVSFNYLGQLDALLAYSQRFEIAGESRGPERTVHARRPYLIEIDGGVVEGRLWINWRFSARHHQRATIRSLAQRFLASLEGLIAHCRAQLDQRRSAPQEATAFPLTPLQEGILFHSLLAPEQALYCEQNSWRLRGALDVARWRRAWSLLLARHPTLRLSFVWQGTDRPLQRVAHEVSFPWAEIDLRSLPPQRRDDALRQALEAERRRGFDLARPPLLRLLLVHLAAEADGDRAWRFAWTAHHLLLDGWSLASLFDELFQIDTALAQGRPLPTVPRTPFHRVIEWLETRDPEAGERFFRQALDGVTPTPVVPPPREGSGQPPHEPSRRTPRHRTPRHQERQRLAAPLHQALDTWGRSQSWTLATLVQAAWGLLLARRARVQEALFGVVVAGRSIPVDGIDTVVGLLINTLPLRLQTEPRQALGTWLRSAARASLELQQHEQVSLAALRRWVDVPAEQPLFDSVLGFQNYPAHQTFLERGGQVVVDDPWSATGAHYPVVLAVLPETELTFELDVDATRLEPVDAARMLRQLTRILRALPTADLQRPLAELPWLDRGERHQLLVEWGLGPEPQTPPLFPQRLLDQARRTPETPAVALGTQIWTYRQLAQETLRLAAKLRARGLGREHRVALLLDRSPRQIAGVLAVWCAGAATVPLDPQAPTARLQHLLTSSRARWLLSQRHHLDRLELSGAAEPIDLDQLVTDAETPSVGSADCPDDLPPFDPDQLAYVLFTSGSTGQPKGAMLTHRGLANLTADPTFTCAPGERMLQLASAVFDASIWELAAALGHGGTLQLVPEGAPPAAEALETLLADGPVHRALIPPSWLATLPVDAAERLPHLDPLLVGGEPCPEGLARRWARGRRLINAYGPTEATVCVTSQQLDPKGDGIPIGRPLHGVRVLVVDPALQPVPVGVVGEVLLGGDGVGRGYLDRPARTAAVFVPDPSGSQSGARLYRTGDLGRWRGDGRLELVGRADHQVKLRGVRLELGEVEAALEAVEGITQAVVVVEGDPGASDRRLIAHALAAEATTLTKTWRSALLAVLPVALVPSRLVVHEHFPRSSSGKVDRRALAASPSDPGGASHAQVQSTDRKAGLAVAPPLDAREELVANLWAEVLGGSPPTHRRANFFELGGHSLLATQVISRIPHIFGVELPLRELFENPTIAQLASCLARRRAQAASRESQDEVALLPATDGVASSEAPLSFAQERLWFLHQLDPSSAAYNSPRAFALEGPLDRSALVAAWGDLLDRHAVLRVTYPTRGGLPVQVVAPEAPPPLGVVDLSRLEPRAAEAVTQTLFEAEADTPFDLASGPLVRGVLVVQSHRRHGLLLHLHHSVLDAESLGLLHRDLDALYQARVARRPANLPSLEIQYPDYARWQRQRLDDARLQRLVERWKQGAGAAGPLPPFELPQDRPRPASSRGRGRFVRRPISSEGLAGVERLARRHNASLFMVVLAHLAILASRLAGRRWVVLGCPIANRRRPELEPLIGFFVNALTLRLEVAETPPLADLIDQVREQVLEAYDLQELPFERLVQALRPTRRLGEHPLFQVSFTVREPGAAPRLGDLGMLPRPLGQPPIRFDLEVYARRGASTLDLELGFDVDLFDASTSYRWTQALATLLEAGVLDPTARVGSLPWMGRGERHQMLWEWPHGAPHGARSRAPSDDPWSRFEHWARRHPEALALQPTRRGAPPATTYGELLTASRQLAQVFERLGLGLEAQVAADLERGPAWVVALLACLATGSVFVPLDPADPPARRDAMVARLPIRLRLLGEGAPQPTSRTPCVWLRQADGTVVTWAAAPGWRPEPRRPRRLAGEALAYAIHTSGTTGTPKAVGVSRSALGQHLAGAGSAYGLTPNDRVLWLASPAFDVSLEQTLGPLTHGATVVIGGREVLDAGGFSHLVAERGVTVANIPPALWSWLVRHDLPTTPSPRRTMPLRLLLVGGDQMPAGDLAAWWRTPWASARLVDAYGPTEAVITASLEVLEHDAPPSTLQPAAAGLPIGRPLAGRTLRVLDARGEPTPVGVLGEVVLGGPVLARGSLGEAAETARRFRPDPWSETPGGRCLWTGDRARLLPNGKVEVLGRRDRQLELRGHRIEPAEIEAALAQHPGVREAWVGLSTAARDPRLTAWVVGEGHMLRALGRRHQLGHWRTVYDELHGNETEREGGHQDPLTDDPFLGWVSHITGEPIPRVAMEDWRAQTLERILALRPDRLLEIGCGHGLVLRGLRGSCRQLVGTDLSAEALRRLAALDTPSIELFERPAHDFRGLETHRFDTVVLNSVVQYFPDVDYLLEVIEGAVAHLGPEGALFLGDVRSLPLLDLLHTLVLRHRDALIGSPRSDTDTGIIRRLDRLHRRESELVLDPFLFLALAERLPRLAGLHLRPKQDRFGSELVRFRYDVTLWLDQPPPGVEGPPSEAETLQILRGDQGFGTLRHHLDRGTPRIRVDGLTPWRLDGGAQVRRLRGLLQRQPYTVEIRWLAPSRRRLHPGPQGDAVLRVWLRRHPDAETRASAPAIPRHQSGPWTRWATNPSRATGGETLVSTLRRRLETLLPPTMRPAAYVLLDRLPRGPRAKVEARFLPPPGPAEVQPSRSPDTGAPGEGTRDEAGSGSQDLGALSVDVAGTPAQTPLERQLAQRWGQLLEIEHVPRDRPFFELGGHSLLATRLLAGLRRDLGVTLDLRWFFAHPTVAEMARHLESQTVTPATEASLPLRPSEDTDSPAPLSHAQEQLWFLDQLEPGNPAYHLSTAFRLQGPLDLWALRTALLSLEGQHASLRAIFPARGDAPRQEFVPPRDRLLEIDLSHLEPDTLPAVLQRLRHRLIDTPFDLARGPLLRSALVRRRDDLAELVLVQHHINSDGWSLGVLLRQLGPWVDRLSTRPRRRRQSLGSAPPRLDSGDYARWQRRRLAAGELDTERRYWRRQLRDLPRLDLPTDHPRTTTRGPGATIPLTVSASTTARLARLARRHDASAYMVVLAALGELLRRWSAQEEAVLGSPMANRGHPELEHFVGFLVNTVVLRSPGARGQDFVTALRAARKVALGAFAHQELPFDQVVEDQAPQRTVGRNPLFQVSLGFQNADATLDDPSPSARRTTTGAPALKLRGIDCRPVDLPLDAVIFELELHLWPVGGTLDGFLAYRRDLFDPTTIRRFGQRLGRLLDQVAVDPRRPLDQLDLLTVAERHQLQVEWAHPHPELAPRSGAARGDLWARLLRRIRQQPEQIAIEGSKARWTYRQLGQRVEALAGHLRDLGIGVETPVGLCFELGVDWVVAVLAVHAAGAVAVPLDPTHPPTRRATLLRQVGARWLLAEVDSPDPQIRRIMPPEPEVPNTPWMPPSIPAEASTYVLFTSGSTGRPKLVPVSRGALDDHLRAIDAALPLTRDDRILLRASPAFDPSQWELWAPLLAGARVLVSDRETRWDARRLAEKVRRRQVSVLRTSPALLGLLLAETELARASSLRRVLCGGEALPHALARRFAQHGPPEAELVNVYGPTETTINVAVGRWHADEPAPGAGSLPLGRPLANSPLRILGPSSRPVALGEIGELVVEGTTLARGYGQRPRDTARVFVPTPVGRAYRTGDRARWLPDGRLQYLGRRDQQVQLRGFRIELGEVESVLRRLPEVAGALAMVRRLEPTNKSVAPILVAFLTPEQADRPIPLRRVLRRLRRELPSYLVPSVLMPLDSLPRTATGKVDRRALSRWPLDPRTSTERSARAPRTPREEVLAELFADCLGLPDVDIDRDFFDLGGHSLLATRLVARIRQALGVDLALATFFRHPTVVALAPQLQAETPRTAQAPRTASPTGPGTPRLPLAPTLRRLWFLARLDPTDASYNLPIAVALRGRLQDTALVAAWADLVARHEGLRSRFPDHEGEPFQGVDAATSSALLARVELQALHPEHREAEALRLAERETGRPFDLAQGPLVRPWLLHLSDDRHQLLLVMHHTLADGWSKGILLRELFELYQARIEGRPARLASLEATLAEVAQGQIEALRGPRLAELETAWRERLTGLEPLVLPGDRPRPARRSSRGTWMPLRVPAEPLTRLRQRSREARATPFMAVLAVTVAWLHRLGGYVDIPLASPVALRDRPETQGLIGFLVNTLVLRLDVSDRPTFAELLQQSRQVALEAFEHQDLPFDRVVRQVTPRRDLGHNPLAGVCLTLHYPEEVPAPPTNLTVDEITVPCQHVQFDLDFDLWLTDAGLEGFLAYRRDLFDATTVQRWVGQWAQLLDALATQADDPVDSVSMLAPGERHQLVWEWGHCPETLADSDRPLVHRRILDQAQRQPDAPAVLWDRPDGTTQALTYGVLAAQAQTLAYKLLDHGLGPETPVGVFAERGPEVVVGILAVLTAGGTVVGLDPDEPPLRLARIAANLGIRHVLSPPRRRPYLPWQPAVVLPIPAPEAEARHTRDVPALDRRRPLPPIDPDQLAYIVHTSGSTGRPKGVMVRHGSWANAFESWRRAYGLEASQRHLQAARLMFDVFAGDFARALASGGTLVICPRETSLDPAALDRWVRRHAIDTGELVPAVARAWCDHLERQGRDLGPVRLLAVGSDRWPWDDLQRLRRVAGPSVQLINSYGLSEATIDSTWYLDPGASDSEPPESTSKGSGTDPAKTAPSGTAQATVPIGRPFPGTRVRVVDRRLRTLPLGGVGELTLAGIGLARGYHGDPRLTAQRFVPDPFSSQPGGRLYRSGDAVRLDRSGNLVVLGRLDRQLKIRGLRVEPAEIEARLTQAGSLREVAVVAAVVAPGTAPVLTAWMVPRSGTTPPPPRELRQTLRLQLPASMVPTRFETVERLPRNANGKIDRERLTRDTTGLIQGSIPQASAQESPTLNADERQLATIWQRLLQDEGLVLEDGASRPQLAPDSDFFELGGHSLMLVKLVAAIRQHWGIEIALAELFERSQLAALARLIGQRRDGSSVSGPRSGDG